MASIITLYCHLMLNDQFLGDQRQLEAILAQVEKNYSSYTIKSTRYQDSAPTTLGLLEKNLESDAGISLVIASGSHGFQFIIRKDVQELLQRKKPLVLWVGHQDPGLIKHKDLFDVVALPRHIIEDKPDLASTFGKRLVAMEAVPNTLQEKDLKSALEKWNTTYSEEAISVPTEGAIGVFLGGPAPQSDGSYLYEKLETIRQRGLKFGELAKQQNKNLYIVNGPRTGKFYSESADPSDPVLRQWSEEHDWISFEKLTDGQREITVNRLPTLPEERRKVISKTIAHAHGTPLDPETAAFVAGVVQSELDKSRYRVFDFKATPGEPVKSAYNAVIAALYQSKDKSIVCYSGESISYAEIAYVIPHTYAFITLTMNDGHTRALTRFSQELGMVGVLDLDKSIEDQPIDLMKKQQSAKNGSQQDAVKVASALEPLFNPKPERSLSSWLPSKKMLVVGGIAIATGLFFLWRSSQKSSATPGDVPSFTQNTQKTKLH